MVESRNRVVPGYGNPNARTMIVGLAPGRNGADITGVPFTRDPSGILMQKALIDCGLSVDSDCITMLPILKTYITNLVKCCPKDAMGRNRQPTADEIENCAEYLREEIDTVKPHRIIAVGRTVFQRLAGMRENMTMIHENSRTVPQIVFAYHPAYAIRGGGGVLRREGYSNYLKSVLLIDSDQT